MLLDNFLSSKPLYYKEIDYTRMPKAWDSISKHFTLPKIIHIVGTNGKGSSGRFLAHYLFKSGVKVGHFTSPHISKFNERIWIDGSDISDELLEQNHKKLLEILPEVYQESLSYFEYTTLLAMISFSGCEYIVLEAGLGGEYDATAVFGSDLTLVTPISIDHQQFLGETIEEIAKTKMNAIVKFAIISLQNYKSVYKISKELVRKKKLEILRYDHFFSTEEKIEAKETIQKLNMADFFYDNLLLAMAGAKFFGFEINFDKLLDIQLIGRCQKIDKNITIDVGHNEAAARVLAQHFKDQKIVLIYNSYSDKNYEKILKILKPIIKRVEILSILNERVEQKEHLVKIVKSLSLDCSEFKTIDDDEDYLVFGSFLVVEEFLKIYGKIK
jgi:dihydrofolate synthase/folylpolyglutamate synthase